nr:diguanylate cyclase [Pseudomonas sp. dw_358]
MNDRFSGLTRLAQHYFAASSVLLVEQDELRESLRACSGVPCALPLDPGLEAGLLRHPLITDSGRQVGELILIGVSRQGLAETDVCLLTDVAQLALDALQHARNEARLQEEVERMRESEGRMALAIANTGTGVWDRNILTDEVHYSAGWKAILGYEHDELTSKISDAYQRLHPDDLGSVKAAMEAHFRGETSSYDVEHRVRCKDGNYKWLNSCGKVVDRGPDGEARRMIGTTTDITERKRLEAELQGLATIDHLTQLPNRRHFMQQLDAGLSWAQRSPARQCAVLMCDLDHFKAINDQWGHAVGDLALQHFASIVRAQLRKGDTAGRIGGEEFALLLNDTDSRKARLFATRLQARLAEYPLIHGLNSLSMTVSIGISTLRPNDAGADAGLFRSDQALYLAKQNGRNRVEEG